MPLPLHFSSSVSAAQSHLLCKDIRPALLPGSLQRCLHADLDGRHRHGNGWAQPLLTFAVHLDLIAAAVQTMKLGIVGPSESVWRDPAVPSAGGDKFRLFSCNKVSRRGSSQEMGLLPRRWHSGFEWLTSTFTKKQDACDPQCNSQSGAGPLRAGPLDSLLELELPLLVRVVTAAHYSRERERQQLLQSQQLVFCFDCFKVFCSGLLLLHHFPARCKITFS